MPPLTVVAVPHKRVLYFLLFMLIGLSGFAPKALLAQDLTSNSHLSELCFAVADERIVEGDDESHEDTLTTLNRTTAETDVIGSTGTEDIEAITFGPGRQLYAANGGFLGTLDLMTGTFTPLPQPLGTAGGSQGEVDLGNIDALAYSLDRGIFFGTERRSGAQPDILFAIDPNTGAHIPNYFGPPGGPNTDYVPVEPIPDEEGDPLTDVDDMEFNPVTGVLYAAMNTGGEGGSLVTVDVATGSTTLVSRFRSAEGGDIIDDIEGLSFDNEGFLYGSTGENFESDPANRNRLFRIVPETGVGTLVGSFAAGYQDYEALACLAAEAAIVLEKYTHGPGQSPEDADTPTGPLIAVDAPVTWTYIFTNTGVLTLTELSLVDDQLGAIGTEGATPCFSVDTRLGPGQGLTCTVTGTAEAGQYSNVATVRGTTTGTIFPTIVVSDTDPSHYFGVLSTQPAITIEKYTNGEDADDPTGPVVAVGSTVTWTYQVSNTGNVPLSAVAVTDNIPGVTPVFVSGDTDSDNALDVGEVWLYRATGTAVAGQYANTGTAQGTPSEGPAVTDSDPSHYFGALPGQPGIAIEKYTNGEDADTPTGPVVTVGSTVTWTYLVSNTSNVPLSAVAVTDNIPGVTPVFVSGDTDSDNVLDVGEVWLYRATGTAVAGQYANTGTARGTPPEGPEVTESDPSHYFGAQPGIDIEKYTNGEDADDPAGPVVAVGSTVTWTYQVSNTGNVPLNQVNVTDNIPGVTPVFVSGDTDSDNVLDVGEVWLFRATGTAVAGQYANTGTARGTPPEGPEVTDSDPSHYFGAQPGIDIEKYTNGEDADDPGGPTVTIGDVVTWTYHVSNTGNVPLTAVTVTDNIAGVTPEFVSGDTDSDNVLDVGEVWIFRATGIAEEGQYANTGTARGTPPVGPDVTDSDTSHYFGDDDTPPTNLPVEEQPNQMNTLFLPAVQADE